jgi:hypothetical protein
VNLERSEAIFWLHGSAGTGKSTIATTIARHFKNDSNRLAASYFFRRGEKDRNGSARFFSTIANELMKTVPTFKGNLRKSLGTLEQDTIEGKGLREQFETLVLNPLSGIAPSSFVLSKLIVIDALDECEDELDVSKMCEQLARLQTLRSVDLRILIVSRYGHPVLGAFRKLEESKTTYQYLSLDKEYLGDAKADITTLLKKEFSSIKSTFDISENPWPDDEKFKTIVSLATIPSPSFIYAATLCRFLDDPTGRNDPVELLDSWLEGSDASQLKQIYKPILYRVLFGSEKNPCPLDKKDQVQLKAVLGAVVFAANPLPIYGLAGLLDIPERRIRQWCQNLHAVVKTPNTDDESVLLYHKSFSDFLAEYTAEELDNFRITKAECHAILASKCIQRMQMEGRGLRREICDIQKPGMLREDIESSLIHLHVPIDLQYACRFWIYHLEHSKQAVVDEGQAHVFFKTHFLHWLEALGWIGKISEGILGVLSLESVTRVSHIETVRTKLMVRYLRKAIVKNYMPLSMIRSDLYCTAVLR